MNGEVESAKANRRQISVGTSPPDAQEVTQLLADWSHGDQAAVQKLTPLVYDELRRLAHHYMERQRPDHTLQTTALVHEAYLRLVDQSRPSFKDRSHFLAVAAKAMRQILVDHARTARRQKRGAGASKVELDEAALISPEQSGAILNLNDALERLASLDSRAAQGVELRYFGGLNQDEIAEVLKVSTVTVRRDWVFSKAWLYRELSGVASHEFR
ncbi:MAG: RNA polymerase subunit sigma-70 [Verrucomicrobia bacterium]|nr:MAG: RNA polymerase subunit sigma-70 [Verrucomicrobiota bacterium]